MQAKLGRCIQPTHLIACSKMPFFTHLNAYKSAINTLLWCLATLPLLYIGGVYHYITLINPFEFLITESGNWALVFFLLSFAVSPLCRIGSALAKQMGWRGGKRLSDWNFLIYQRRMLGLVSFYYASIHFCVYFYFEIDFSLPELWLEITERHFILMGILALLILAILAITSLQYFRELLRRNWKYLHQLVYPTAVLLMMHIVLAEKTLGTDSLWFFSVFTVFSLERLLHFYQYLRDKRNSELMRLARQTDESKKTEKTFKI